MSQSLNMHICCLQTRIFSTWLLSAAERPRPQQQPLGGHPFFLCPSSGYSTSETHYVFYAVSYTTQSYQQECTCKVLDKGKWGEKHKMLSDRVQSAAWGHAAVWSSRDYKLYPGIWRTSKVVWRRWLTLSGEGWYMVWGEMQYEAHWGAPAETSETNSLHRVCPCDSCTWQPSFKTGRISSQKMFGSCSQKKVRKWQNVWFIL